MRALTLLFQVCYLFLLHARCLLFSSSNRQHYPKQWCALMSVECSLAVLPHAGIKAVKLYAWERPFERRINHLRWLELEQIRCGGCSTLR